MAGLHSGRSTGDGGGGKSVYSRMRIDNAQPNVWFPTYERKKMGTMEKICLPTDSGIPLARCYGAHEFRQLCSACSVGKGAGTALPRGEAFRAPWPPTESMRAPAV